MKCKKLFSAILAMSMTISTFAALTFTANAETTAKKTMNMGSSVIANGDPENSKWDYIYYGYNGDAKKWRVLSTNGNTTDGETVSFSDGTNTVAANKALFVISENDLGKRAFDPNWETNWQVSEAKAWCNGTEAGQFYKTAGITDTEQKAILQTSKTDAAYRNYKACSIEDKVFYLSAKEATTYFNSDDDRKFTAGGGGYGWWLRSAYIFSEGAVGTVGVNGDIAFNNASFNRVDSRPAFNLNSESVLFTSAADFDDTDDTIGNYDGNEWKLTLKDSTRNFAIDKVAKTGNTLMVEYTGAKTGANEKISYIITDKEQNEIKYYGSNIVGNEGMPGGVIAIPLSNMADDDRLFVFNEQDNGKNKTNYASELKEVQIPATITYLGWDDVNKKPVPATVTGYTLMTDGMNELNSGWYVVKGNVTVNDTRIYTKGDVHLILCDGAKLTAKIGINVGKGNSLTIYGQEGGTGELTATADVFYAGIGGDAGAGSNNIGNSGDVTINGGKITAQGGFASAGIGGGLFGVSGSVTVNGGDVRAIGGFKCAGITNGSGAAEGANLSIDGNMIILAGKTEVGMELLSLEEYKNNINIIEDDNEQKYVWITHDPYTVTESGIDYIDPTNDIPSQSADKYIALDENTDLLDSRISNGVWFVVKKNVVIPSRITVNGNVNLILCDGAKLTASKGISVKNGNSLTIYGQENGTGELTATADVFYAGIGGDAGAGSNNIGNSGDVTINGGKIRAQGGFASAGIGGGLYGVCGTVTVNGGDVRAVGGYKCAGITNGSGAAEGTNLTIGDNMLIFAGNAENSMEVLSLDEYRQNINIVEDYNEQRYVHILSCRHEGKAATCGKDGSLAYYEYNGKYYKDSGLSQEITDLTEWLNTDEKDGGGLLPAMGHNWVCGTGEDSMYHICSNGCGEKEEHTFGADGKCTGCGLHEFVVDKYGTLTEYNGNGGDVVIPDEVTAIANKVFMLNNNITSVSMPNVIDIKFDVFYGCGSLESVEMPNVTDIGSNAFNGCGNLVSVEMPNVTSIGDFAFRDCKRLVDVSLPKITSVKDSTFYNCQSLESVSMPKAESIGNSAFYGCEKLQSITVSDSLTTVGYSAFNNTAISTVYCNCNCDVDALQTVLDKNYTYIKSYHNFEGGICTGCGLHEFDVDANGTLTAYNGRGGDVVIPDEVTTIEKEVFMLNNNITSVSMPNVTNIGPNAFNECGNLINVETPKVTDIGTGAFNGCGNLVSVEMPNVKSIGFDAFNGCGNLINVETPNATDIGYNAFNGCGNLISVEMPNVTNIGSYAFNECGNLVSVEMPKVESIGNSAFYECGNLISVEMPNVNNIEDSAFYGCGKLISVEMPNVTSIGDSAFYGCEKLQSITVSDSLTAVGYNAFNNAALFTVYCNCNCDVDALQTVLGKNYTYIKSYHNFEGGICTGCGKVLPNKLSLEIKNNTFTVTPSGKDAGSGVVIVALYDGEKMTRLLDVKIFYLSKTDDLTGIFKESGYVCAMWWSSLSDITPLCGAEDDFMTVNLKKGTFSGASRFLNDIDALKSGTFNGFSICE